MKSRWLTGKWAVLVLTLALVAGLGPEAAMGGNLRITMNDGTSLEVPFYWEENGEVRFETPGGVAGVPKNQVASVQEIVLFNDYDPEVLAEPPKNKATPVVEKMVQELVQAKLPTRPDYQQLSPEESQRLLEMADGRSNSRREKVSTPLFTIEWDLTEMVRADNNEVLLLVRQLLSSRADLRGHSFKLTLYDGEGNVLLNKPCEVIELNVDKKTLRKMNIKGNIFAVSGTIKPDSRIKHYEITAAH